MVSKASRQTAVVKYKPSSITAKGGVNFVRTIVEEAGCLFQKIEQENDLGIDALIEFLSGDGRPLNIQVAVQIKSGASYYSSEKEQCLIPIKQHREYWLGHPLPVIGIVYIPAFRRAHWVDIKVHLNEVPQAVDSIRFLASEANRLDRDTFQRIFVPRILGRTPRLPFEEAVALFESSKADEFILGMHVLFRWHPNRKRTWRGFVNLLLSRPREQVPNILMYYLAHIPWHGDIGWTGGEPITEDTRIFVRKLIARFDKVAVIKLLRFIDENGVSRGAVGQSVEAIISSLPDAVPILNQICRDKSIPVSVREGAAIIFTAHKGKAAIPKLTQLAHSGSERFAAELIAYIREYGDLNLYG